MQFKTCSDLVHFADQKSSEPDSCTQAIAIEVMLLNLCRYVPVFAPGYSKHAEDEEGATRRGVDVGKSLLRQMDYDGDGMISRAEFRSILTDTAELDSLSNYDMRIMVSQSIDGNGGLKIS
jgi:hypothetical protein